MGLLTNIIAAPVKGPISGAAWVIKLIAQEAEKELYDLGNITRDLAALELKFELGEIDEKAFEQAENVLLERLAIARKMKEGRQ